MATGMAEEGGSAGAGATAGAGAGAGAGPTATVTGAGAGGGADVSGARASAIPLLYPYWHQANSASERLSDADLSLIGRYLS